MTKRNSKKGTLQKTNRRTMAIIRHMRRSAFSAGRPGGLITETAGKAGESELICLHGGLRLCRLAGDIESGRGDIKDKKRQSSYAVKSSIHAIGVKNILIFPIHEVRKEGGGGNQNSGL